MHVKYLNGPEDSRTKSPVLCPLRNLTCRSISWERIGGIRLPVLQRIDLVYRRSLDRGFRVIGLNFARVVIEEHETPTFEAWQGAKEP